MPTTPGQHADLIDYAADVIIAARHIDPRTGPAHWAGALLAAGVLVPPGTPNVTESDPRCPSRIAHQTGAVLRCLHWAGHRAVVRFHGTLTERWDDDDERALPDAAGPTQARQRLRPAAGPAAGIEEPAAGAAP